MYANAIFNGDYPDVMKERISSRSKEQGFKTSRLPSFTEEEKSRIKGTCDFFGLNHYTTHLVKHLDYPTGFNIPSLSDDVGAKTHQPVDWPQGASSWLKVVPWGFRKMLNWISDNYGSPEIIVFENGFSDKGGVEDENRVNYYKTYMNAMLDAIDDGSNITGYTAWSLMDNFEWRNGYM